MKRREFIILSSIGATSASLLSACGHPEEKLIPVFIPDEEYVPGIDYWKASTCGMCPAGCGIIVRTREHKANKIEGNPLHPVNRGALCARGQAGLQVLYNPDRIKGPMKRVGERGEGKWEEISWDEAIKTLADKLREIKAHGRADSVMFAINDSKGVTGLVAEHFMAGFGARILITEEWLGEASAVNGYSDSYGRATIPTFDIPNATYLLSFGARFLETWHSPVMYSLAYGEFRRRSGRARGKFIQVEPRMSLTAANADEWLPAAIGTEGLLALAVAQVITREGSIKDAPSPKFLMDPLESYAPEKTAELIDIPSERIVRVAREFAASERPLAIASGAAGSGENELQNLIAINFLNTLVGNLNKPGGMLLPAADYFDPLQKLRGSDHTVWLPSFDSAFGSATPEALLVHQVNPTRSSPSWLGKIKSIPFIASFSSFIDETTQLADLVLPDNSYLESCDIKTSHLNGTRAIVSISQPVIKPELNTKQTADVLIALTGELGGPIAFDSAEAIVRQAIAQLQKANRAGNDQSRSAEGSEDAVKDLTERGVWEGEVPVALRLIQRGATNISLLSQSALRSNDFALKLIVYEHSALGFGEQANLPQLQELPDPMTSVMWGSWVEINPKTAASLGIADGDLVEVSTEHGSVRVPAVAYPAIRPDVIAIPYGQGHTTFGRYGSGRGVNPTVLNPDGRGTVEAKITKVEGKANLIRFGTDLWQELEKKR
jgi:menaquinone reductase, molybdopterin-binding-like subunit